MTYLNYLTVAFVIIVVVIAIHAFCYYAGCYLLSKMVIQAI